MWRLLRVPAFLLALLLELPAPPALHAQQPSFRVDYVFLLDISGSMNGQAGHKNIFPEVRQALLSFSKDLQPGTTIFVLPFDQAVKDVRRFEVRRVGDVPGLEEYIGTLQPNGTRTAVFDSIAKAVQTAEDHRATIRGESAIVFFVYTDGDDNVSKKWTLQTILEHFSLKRGPRDWLFYSELGLPRDQRKEHVFGQFDRMRYVSDNDVHPIVHVQALLPALNFGNLRDVAKATRTEKFVTTGKSPAGFAISAEADFPDVTSQGSFMQVSPASFPPQDVVPLDLSLVNPQGLRDGSYRGRIRLKSTDPLVLVAPDAIDVSFLYEPPRMVDVSPDVGTTFPLALGYAGQAGRTSAPVVRAMRFHFNGPAKQGAERLRVRIVQDSANPAPLQIGKVLRLEGIEGEEGWIPATTERRHLVAVLPAAAKPGQYKGEILIESETVQVKGLQPAKQPASYSLPWSLTVAKAPIPGWVWLGLGLVLLTAGGFAAWLRFKPSVFEDLKLEVLTPVRRTIDLAGRPQMAFGKNGEELQDSHATFVIRATREGRTQSAVLHLAEGQIQVKHQGVKQEIAVIGQEPLFDGDVLRFDDYKVRVSSFTLTRQ